MMWTCSVPLQKWTGGVADRRSKIEVRKTDHPPLPAADPAGDAPMDFEKALEEFEGDEAFLAEVLEGFRGNVKSQIKTIHQALTDGNVEVVGKEAHSIKGGAGNLTAEKLAGIARELEDKAKSGVLDGGFSLLERLEKEFQRLEVYVDKRSG